MPDNVFAANPLQHEINRQKGGQDSGSKSNGLGATSIPEISGKTKVPLNVVEAFTEAVTNSGQIEDPAQVQHIAHNFSTELGKSLESGKDMRTAMAELLKDDADPIIERALGIAKERNAKPVPEGGTSFKDRKGNFITDMYSGAMGSIGAAAQALGRDETAEYFGDIAEKHAPAVQSYKDVHNFGEGVRYVTGGIAQSIPEMAAVAGAAILAGLSAPVTATGAAGAVAVGASRKLLGKKAIKVVASGAGALGASTLFNAGRAAERQMEEGAEEINYAVAWGAGTAMGSLDAVLPGTIGSGVAKAFSKRMAGATVEATKKHGLTKAFFKGMAVEAPTEVAQELIEMGQANPDLFRILVNPNDDELEKSDQLLTGLIDNALIGGLAGGAFGGGGHLVQKAVGGRPQPEAAPTPEEQLQLESPPLVTPPPGADTAGEGPQGGPQEPQDPEGPLGRAEQAAGPRQTPQAPESTVKGAKVKITTPDGVDLDGTFVEETAEGTMLKVDGAPMLVTRDQIDNGEIILDVQDPIANQRAEMDAQDEQYSADILDEADAFADAAGESRDAPDTKPEVAPEPEPTITGKNPTEGYVVTPPSATATDQGRAESIAKALKETLDAAGISMSDADRRSAHTRLNEEGGNVEDVIWSVLESEPDEGVSGETSADDGADIPFGDTTTPDTTAAPETGTAVTVQGKTYTKSDGKPFGDQKAAARYMRANGLGQGDHDIVSRDGGYVVVQKAKATPAPKSAEDIGAEVDDALADAMKGAFGEDAPDTGAAPDKTDTTAGPEDADANFKTRKVGEMDVLEYMQDGKPVGELYVRQTKDGPQAASMKVDESHRRKGVATKLYDRAGITTATDNLTKDAFDFWQKRDPEQVKGSLYHHYDKLMGQTVKASESLTGEIVDVRSNHVSVKKGGVTVPVYRAELEKMGLIPDPNAQQGVTSKAEEMLAKARERIKARKELAESLTKDDKPLRMRKDGGLSAVVSKSPDVKGGWRISYLDDKGPSGHTDHKTKHAATMDALQQGYKPHDGKAADTSTAGPTEPPKGRLDADAAAIWDGMSKSDRIVFIRQSSVTASVRPMESWMKQIEDTVSEKSWADLPPETRMSLARGAIGRDGVDNAAWEGAFAQGRVELPKITAEDAQKSMDKLKAEYEAEEAAKIDAAAKDADAAPTDGQKEAGNYKKGHVAWEGLDITIENERGSERSGTAPDGSAWSVTMPAHYGYFKRTEGADGDHVDVYIGEKLDKDSVTIIDQKDLETGEFDEHKVVIGAGNNRAARALFREGFSDGQGSQRIMGATTMTVAEFKTWVAEGDHTKPVAAPKEGKAGDGDKKPVPPKGDKIVNFGNKIGGSRKDRAGKFVDGLGADVNVASMTLTDAFPKPDYEALVASGIPHEAVAAVAAIRGAIERKPSTRRSYRVEIWADNVKAARTLAHGLINGTITPQDMDASESKRSRMGNRLASTMKAFAGLPADMLHEASVAWEVVPVLSSRDAEATIVSYNIQKPGKYRIYGQPETIEAATNDISEKIKLDRITKEALKSDTGGGRKPVKLEVYRTRTRPIRWFIGYKVSDVVEIVGGFEDNKAAHDYLKENEESLHIQADSLRDLRANMRRKKNLERKGPKRREGNATQKMYEDSFGFNGVEFGEWKNQKERQDSLNRAYDALLDLAGALDVPMQALSLYGTLGLAFGARGRGGRNPAAAHYEQERTVINLTKKNGAGSLAHEWFHAIDNHLAKEDAKNGGTPATLTSKGQTRTEFMSDRVSTRNSNFSNSDVGKAFRTLQSAITKQSAWLDRAKKADGARSLPYFSTTIELAARGFEKHVIDQLTLRGMRNDYLVNIDERSGAYPSSRESQRDGIKDAFIAATDAIRDVLVKEGDKADMPDLDQTLLNNGPDVGESWNSIDGQWSIVERDGGTYTVESPNGATEIYNGAEAIEALIAEAAQRKDEANDIAKESATAAYAERQEHERRAKEIGERYTKDTDKNIGSLWRVYNFSAGHYSRLGMIAKFVEEGWRLNGDAASKSTNLVSPKGSAFARGVWTQQGIDFAGWYGSIKDLEARREAEGEAGAVVEMVQAKLPEGYSVISVEDTPADEAKRKQAQVEVNVREPSGQTISGYGADINAALADVQSIIGDLERSAPAPDTSAADALDAEVEAALEEAAEAAFKDEDSTDSDAPKSDGKQPSGADDVRTAAEAAKDAAANVGKGADAAMDGLMKLFGGKDTLNSGFTFSKETYDLAKPLFKEAMAKFGEAGSDIKQMAVALINGLKQMGMTAGQVAEMMPYLKRYIVEAQGEQATTETTETATPDAETSTDTYAPLREAVRTHLDEGGAYGDIRSLRKQAAEAMGRPIEKSEHKAIEEAAEEAIVGKARSIVEDATLSDADRFDQLVTLYESQPLLNEKTSTSVENQAYSTPAPLAFIASKLAGITAETVVNEPSAGTGMLVIGADPANVTANEKNPERVAALRRNLPGAVVTEGDATTADYAPYDVLITNPPFGKVSVKGETQTWPMAKTTTNQIDHAIAWRALEAMPEGGSAVLILGGVNPRKYTGESRKDGYRTDGKRQFYANLYENYDVVDHFTADGSLYRRQGAAWPVDVVVIRGRGKSSLPLPMAEAPAMITSWADMKGKLNVADSLGTTERQPSVGRPDSTQDAGKRGDGPVDLPRTPNRQDGSPDGVDGPSGTGGTGQPNTGQGGKPTTAGNRDTGKDGNTDAGKDGQKGDAGRDTGNVSGGRTVGRPDGSDTRKHVKRENTEAETDLQVHYDPRSSAVYAIDTLVPVNMRDAITVALDAIEAEKGSIDQYVADSLGYSLDELLGTKDKSGYFAAEQVDALAMAISNVERGKGFIIGDQTGVGKGRVVAAMLRYAERQGRVPVFVTKSPGLYSDMIRDMSDIGETEAHNAVMVTNNDLRGAKAIPLPVGMEGSVASLTPKNMTAAIAHMSDTGTLPEGMRFLFTTYKQMQATAGKEPPRRNALRSIAPNAMFIFDESHEAGGGVGTSRAPKKGAPPNLGEFARELVDQANGTVFSSATYAKNPDVMSLYSSTDLSLAVKDPSRLGDAIAKGGVPLQQVTAGSLTEAGQYARREKSWDGVPMDLNPVEVDQAQAARVTDVIAGIFDTDVVFLADARKAAMEKMAQQGYAEMPGGRAVDIASADDTGFSSVLHNVVSQMLLSLKVESVANRAIEAFKAGEKPLIAVVNTNGALLEAVIEDTGLSMGDLADVPFSVILHRYVDRLRRITVKDADDKSHRVELTDDQLGPTAVRELRKMHERIDATDLSGMSAAPLDQMKDLLTAAGMNVGEITGRKNIIVDGVLTKRDNSESAKKREVLAFNDGGLDALLINQAGSTGYSLHAIKGAMGNDGKPRRMLVLQPDPNIDTFMQMLGRIHRTGQTSLPAYDIMISDLAIEKRIAAILMRKMASLSANTTASKDSSVSFDGVTDFLNEVGDKVVRAYLMENYDIASRLQIEPTEEGVANKLTGRLALMAPHETQKVYDDIELLYNDEIAALNAAGENPLVAQVVDWQAQTVSRSVVAEGTGTNSPLDADTVVEQLSVRRIGKPYKLEEITTLVDKNLGQGSEAVAKAESLKGAAIDSMKRRLTELEKAVKSAEETKEAAPKRFEKAKNDVRLQEERMRAFNSQFNKLTRQLNEFTPGSYYTIELGSGNVPAVVIGLDSTKVDGNPLAKGKYRVRFAVADAMREIGIPLSKLEGDGQSFTVTHSTKAIVDDAIENGQTLTRENRQVVTGNLINAFAMFDKGQVTIFTDEDGSRRTGVALPKGFDAANHLDALPVMFENVDQIMTFVESVGSAIVIDSKSDRKSARFQIATAQGGFIMNAKKGAKEFFAGDAIKDITGEWQARGNAALQVHVDADTLRKALTYYSKELGTTFKTETNKEAARLATGQKLPEVKPAAEQGGTKESRAPDGWGEVEGDAPLTRSELLAVQAQVDAEMAATGLFGKVPARVLRSVINAVTGRKVQGAYGKEVGAIQVAGNTADGPIGTLRHEIIHALRDSALWGSSHGLFTKAEWQGLVREARKNKALMDETKRKYGDLDATAQMEEAVAETYRMWRESDGKSGPFAKVRALFEALSNALRGNGFQSAARTMQQIADGKVGRRGGPDPKGPSAKSADTKESRFGSLPFINDSNPSRGRKGLVRNILTQAMVGKDSGRVSILGLVPGRALFAELGKRLPAAQKYLEDKIAMDAYRNEAHSAADVIAQKWRKLMSKAKSSNAKMMDLMHASTRAEIDPAKPFRAIAEPRDSDIVEVYAKNSPTYKAAKRRLDRDEVRRERYNELRKEYQALPKGFREIFQEVRDAYKKQSDEADRIILEQVGKAMDISAQRAERAYDDELQRVRDEGLKGKAKTDALAAADKKLKNAKAKAGMAKNARIAELRKKFEANRLEGAYFPLARFGELFVTSRDKDGVIVSFSTFESVEGQLAEQAAMEKAGHNVEIGTLDYKTREQSVDPNFVADIENLLSGIDVNAQLMDEIWQRYLTTLPDLSIRKSKIHRKGTPGYSGDAFRAFGKQMFHGAHQLARLKYSLEMAESLEVAQREAKADVDPVRSGLIVREMKKRHEYVMNPEGSAWAQSLTSAAFVYYLGMTPAAAIVNLSQTVVIGVPVLGAFYGKGGVRAASAELVRALGDFTKGKANTIDSKSLTDDERAAMKMAGDRGDFSKTQSHDLAGVGESGVEYSAVRTAVMEKISFFFHHAERLNREVTFLAAYRLARRRKLSHEDAILKASDLTLRSHYDYQNTSRPRLMQNDFTRVAFVFKNYQINTLWRLFRDLHQSTQGKSKEERKEAAAQLVGITGQMLFHAGVKGTWGYALTMALLGVFFAGGSDDAEEALEDGLLNYMPKDAAAMILNGVPGHLLGINITQRIGMPELWFRSPNREMEGEDEYNYWMQQVLGAVPGMAKNVWRGVSMARDDHMWRGVETMSPKFIRDMMKTGRYWTEGAETYRGDPIIDKFKTHEALAQFIGFTPARLSERYDLNSRMKNRERAITDERKDILGEFRKAHRNNTKPSQKTLDKVVAFNKKHPSNPIRGLNIKQSIQGGIRSSQRNMGGVQLNPRLERSIRESTRDPFYSD